MAHMSGLDASVSYGGKLSTWAGSRNCAVVLTSSDALRKRALNIASARATSVGSAWAVVTQAKLSHLLRRCETIERMKRNRVFVLISRSHEDSSREPRRRRCNPEGPASMREKPVRLDFDGEKLATAPQQEVDFSLPRLGRRPVRRFLEQL